ncbi:MAG: replication/maintenance protein RepL [Betaproteobacteria bacterium]|nr:replication/maintenance protein RepL [Betaproteobacteria bacterium]
MRYEKVTEVIDSTGKSEKTREVVNTRKMPQEPNYVKVYIDDLGRLLNVQESHRSILLYIAASINYDGFLTLVKARKERIAATVGVSVKTVSNAVSELVKIGILRRAGRSEYELDPHLFGKGDWASIRERRQAFKVELSYSPTSGRTIKLKRDN